MPLTPISRPFGRAQTAGRTRTGGYYRDKMGLTKEIPTQLTADAAGDFDEEALSAMQIDRGTNGLQPGNAADQVTSNNLAKRRMRQLRRAMAAQREQA